MPRKTGYKTRSALSTLQLGDPDVGTTVWDTEYDVEFTGVVAREERAREQVEKQSARASLRTPRSLKKGYVSGQDYEKLDEEYSNALLAYRDLQLQVGVLEQRMASMQGNEAMLLRAAEDQHGLIETLRQQVAAMTDSLSLLLGGVERNKSLLALLNPTQQDPPLHKPVKASEGDDSVTARLSALEARIGDMADAVESLSQAQMLMVSRTAGSGYRGTSGREGAATAGRRPSINGRESSSGGRRPHQTAERIERLPNPIQLVTRSSAWKP